MDTSVRAATRTSAQQCAPYSAARNGGGQGDFEPLWHEAFGIFCGRNVQQRPALLRRRGDARRKEAAQERGEDGLPWHIGQVYQGRGIRTALHRKWANAVGYVSPGRAGECSAAKVAWPMVLALLRRPLLGFFTSEASHPHPPKQGPWPGNPWHGTQKMRTARKQEEDARGPQQAQLPRQRPWERQ